VAARDAGLVALRSLATRTAGINRFETAVELVRSQFTTADAVVLTTGRSFADAVCGAPLAQALGAPMLMTERTAVPALVIDEIRRLGAKKIYILGGTGAVSDSVVTQLKSEFSLTDADIVRIAGANRYETSANIARKLAEIKGYTVAGATKDVGEVFVANGENFPDALAASGVAAKVGVPILLVTPQWLPAATSDVITDLKWPRAVVIGGRGAVSDGVYTAVRGKDRWYGNDRYATATDIARKAIRDRGLRIDEVMVATGNDFPDALAAGVIAAKTRQPLLLTGTYLPTATSDFLAANRMAINDVTLVGGTGAVTSEAATAISAVLH
jgi:putative cell wall-binding protein